jgi:hypothetical protein
VRVTLNSAEPDIPLGLTSGAGKKTREYCVALFVATSYHRTMTFWQTAKQGEYAKPCSRRELALSTRTVADLGH